MKTTLTGNISDDKLILFSVELKLLIIFRTHGLFMSFYHLKVLHTKRSHEIYTPILCKYIIQKKML